MKKGFLTLAIVVAFGALAALGASAREASEGPRHFDDFGRRTSFNSVSRSFDRSVLLDGTHRHRNRGNSSLRRFRTEDSGRHGVHHLFNGRSIHR